MSILADMEIAGLSVAPKRRGLGLDRTMSAIAVIAVLTVVVCFALLPGAGEKAEALMTVGRYPEAQKILIDAQTQRPLDSYERYMLLQLYLLNKQPEQAAALIETEVPLLPETVDALPRLAELFRTVRNFSGEASALSKLYAVRPTPQTYARLRLLYRLIGDPVAEATTLVRGLAAGHASEIDQRRLTYLLANTGQVDPAVLWTAPQGRYASFAPS